MHKKLHSTLYNACNYLSLLGFKLICAIRKGIRHQYVKPWKCGDKYMGQWTESSLVQVMACHQFSTKLLAESMVTSLIARFMGLTWGPSGVRRTQVGPMLAPWTLLSGLFIIVHWEPNSSKTAKYKYFNSQRCILKYCVQNVIHFVQHYNDIIMGTTASQITSLLIVYSTLIPAQIKEKIKAPRHWPLWGEFIGDQLIPHTKGQ